MMSPILFLVGLKLMASTLPPTAAAEYERRLYPQGVPPLISIVSGEAAPAHFALLGQELGTAGETYVLYSLAVDGRTEETHKVFLARLGVADDDIARWDLTAELAAGSEPTSGILAGVVAGVRGCVSLAPDVGILHVSLMAEYSGTGAARDVSEVFWQLPLAPIVGAAAGVHLRGVGQYLFTRPELGESKHEINPKVSLWEEKSGGRPVVVVEKDGQRTGISLAEPGKTLLMDPKDLGRESRMCRIDLLSRAVVVQGEARQHR